MKWIGPSAPSASLPHSRPADPSTPTTPTTATIATPTTAATPATVGLTDHRVEPGSPVDVNERYERVDGSPHERSQRGRTEPESAANHEAEIGDPGLGADLLQGRSALFLARHLMVLLARRPPGFDRAASIRSAVGLLVSLERGDLVRRVLLEMETLGIVDVYPLEVMVEVMADRPDLLLGFEFGEIILNKAALALRAFDATEPIEIQVPLAAKVKAFALQGGGDPGYCFRPGPLARYILEIESPGNFQILVRAEMHKKHVIDRCAIQVRGRSAES